MSMVTVEEYDSVLEISPRFKRWILLVNAVEIAALAVFVSYVTASLSADAEVGFGFSVLAFAVMLIAILRVAIIYLCFRFSIIPAGTPRVSPGESIDEYRAMEHVIDVAKMNYLARPLAVLFFAMVFAAISVITVADIWVGAVGAGVVSLVLYWFDRRFGVRYRFVDGGQCCGCNLV